MNIPTFILCVLIAAGVFFALRRMARNLADGTPECCGELKEDASSCGSSCACCHGKCGGKQ